MSAPNISFEAFLKQNGVARIWRDPSKESPSDSLGSLPLETLLSTQEASANRKSPAQRAQEFSSLAEAIQEHLLNSRRRLVATRSLAADSPESEQGLTAAQAELDLAEAGLEHLKSLARKMGPQQRRVVRILEGAPDWRRIRHALKKQGRSGKGETMAA